MDATVLNYIVVASLVFFAVALGGLVWALQSLVPQISKTLNAYEHLAGTLEGELTPTLREVNKVVAGLTELKSIASKNVTEVTTKVEDVTGNITKAAGTAKKQSSVWGAGFMAGARAYFEGGHNKSAAGKEQKQEEKSEHKQIAANRGEENVGFKR